MNKDNDLEQINSLTIQEASKELSVPENTLRKYLVYFEIDIIKQGRKTLISQAAVGNIAEIVQLKANGWSLKEIKNFRDKPPGEATPGDVTNESVLEASSALDSAVATVQQPDLISSEVEQYKAEIVSSSLPASDATTELPNSVQLEDALITGSEIPSSFAKPLDSVASNHHTHLQENSLTEKYLLDSSEQEIDNAHEPSILSTNEAEQSQSDESDDSNLDFNDENGADINQRIKELAVKTKLPLTKDLVNKEIAMQAKRASRLYRFLGGRNAARDTAEIKADLDRRVIFLNGLRYLRDNWLDRRSEAKHRENSRNEARENNRDLPRDSHREPFSVS